MNEPTRPGHKSEGRSPTRAETRYECYCREQLPELTALERLIAAHPATLSAERLGELPHDGQRLPLYALSMGAPTPGLPVLTFVGGIHGVERIGTQVLLGFIDTLLQRLTWDQGLQEELAQLRLLFLPLINPVGMALGRRSNGQGVDLMRNAPLDAEGRASWLVGGHRLSPHLPWYRGKASAPMQAEAQLLCNQIEGALSGAPFSLVLDCHSGFGFKDRLWFPYAGSRRPCEHLGELHSLLQLFEGSYPHHNYVIEPQCHHYTAHGDLWDYLYRRSQARSPVCDFLPLTLELGSWRWVKKSPWQQASFRGLFNPLVPHRHQRTLRRHHLLLEFLIRATRSYRAWLPDAKQQRQYRYHQARRRWYEQE